MTKTDEMAVIDQLEMDDLRSLRSKERDIIQDLNEASHDKLQI